MWHLPCHAINQTDTASVAGESSHFDGNIRIQGKLAINSDASDLTLSISCRKVVQIELVSEVINAKTFVFAIK